MLTKERNVYKMILIPQMMNPIHTQAYVFKEKEVQTLAPKSMGISVNATCKNASVYKLCAVGTHQYTMSLSNSSI